MKRTSVLYFRWLLAVFILIYTFLSPSGYKNYILLETLALAFIYNLIISFRYLRQGNKTMRLPVFVAYLDAIFLSAVLCHLGGIESDIYVFFFFVIGGYSMSGNPADVFRIGAVCVAAFSAASYFASAAEMQQLSIFRLVIKDLLLVISSIGTSRISSEVHKFNELHKKEFKLARTDKLTGLANRHYFDQKLSEELEYSDVTGNPLNILIFDLDNFKNFNDTHGHPSGDKLLMLFSQIIRENIRKTDIPVRYGGEEFLVIMRDMDICIAASVGERIRRQLECQKLFAGKDEEKIRVTVSCGIAQYPRHSSNIKKAIDCADRALYYAKENGKNRTVTFDDIAV